MGNWRDQMVKLTWKWLITYRTVAFPTFWLNPFTVLKHSQYTFWGYFLAKVLKKSEKMEITSVRNSGGNLKTCLNGTRHRGILYAVNVKSVIMVFVHVFGNTLWAADFLFVFIRSVLTSLSSGEGRMSIDIVRRHLIFTQSFPAGYTIGRVADFILMKCR